jgi:capsular exopolysaccharide synthesis family protein
VVPLTAFFTSTRQTIYESYSTFLLEVPETRGETPQLEVLARAGQVNTLSTEAELMRSRRVVEPAVRNMGLHVRVDMNGTMKPAAAIFSDFAVTGETPSGTYRIIPRADGGYGVRDEATGKVVTSEEKDSTLSFAGLSFSPPDEGTSYVISVGAIENFIGSAQSRIAVEPVGADSDLLQLICKGTSPEAAHDLCQAVTQSYMDVRFELQRAEATAAIAFLEEQLGQISPRLEEAEDSLGDYQERNLAVGLDARAAQEVGQYGTFRAQRDELIAQQAALRQLINQIETQPGGQGRDFASLPTFIQNGNPVIGSLLGSLVQLENERATLAKTRTDRNPDIVAIDTRIAEIEAQLGTMATKYDQSLTAQVGALNSIVGQAAGRMSAIPEKQVATSRLSRQVALLDDAYRRLQGQLREAQMAASISIPTVRIVDGASTPGAPVSPNWPLNMLLGAVLGFSFGLAVALWQDYMDTSIRERQELKTTGVPVLAMLPTVRGGGPILPVSRVDGDRALQVRPGLQHEIAREAFWGLVTDLQFASRRLDNGGLHSVAITSTTRGEGKTFNACNLALAQANGSVRTLLIDADLRGKGATRFFQLAPQTPGLTDVLAGSLHAHEAWRPLIVDGRGELFLLAAGSSDSKHREHLDLDALSRLIDDAEAAFDMVVIDTPPLNIVSDAAAVVANVDGVIVVVRGEFTDRTALDFTLERLKRTDAEILGLVLNDVDLPTHYTSYSHAGNDTRAS